MSNIFNISLVYATLRSATPLIYAAMCASISQQANILNIGTEGIMLTGAFFAVAGSYFSGAWYIGVLAAIVAGFLMALVMAVGHLRFGADITAIGIGINVFSLALTKFMLNVLFGVSGTFTNPEVKTIPTFHLPLSEDNILGQLFNDWPITQWFTIVLLISLHLIFYKSVWGLRLRAVGQHSLATETVGINATAMKYQAILISGIIGGLAGAHLSLGYGSLFTENMTANRGFMGVAAMYFGGADPFKTTIGCLVFGLADSIGARLQAYGIAPQLILMMPYMVTVIVLAISMYTQVQRRKRQKSSLIENK